MKEVFLLTKILFKNSINSNNKKSKNNSPFKILGWALLYMYLIGIIGYISFETIVALKAVNQEEVFLSFALVILLGMTIMRSLFTSINVLFFSKDTEYVLPLPIKSYKIIIAKINCLIISEYLMAFIILLPAFIVYGYLLKLSILFYIMALAIIFIIPIIPIMIVSLIITVVMKCTNIIRNKDFVQYITIILSLLLILGVMSLTGLDNQITNEELAAMLVKANGLSEVYTKYFFTLKPATNVLKNYNTLEGINNLIVLFGETVFIYSIGIFIMSKFYIKTVTNIKASTTLKRKETNQKEFKQNSIMKSYVKKEFQILKRNPIFFMQCVVPSILFPIIFTVPMCFGVIKQNPEILEMVKNVILLEITTPFGISIAVSVLVFFYMFNYISITSVSRDRENAVFMKYIPISLEKQCLYKILPGIIMNFIPNIYFIVFLKILVPNNEINESIIFITLISTLLNVLNNYLMILIDLKNPKLNWTTEYAVVKQNLNMLWEMMIYILEIIILIFWSLRLTNILIYVCSVSILLILFIKHIKKYISTNENKLFEKII